MTLLRIARLNVFYGRSQALFDLDVEVTARSIVVLLGANGAGKSTTIRTVSGLLKPKSGQISFRGRSIAGLPPHVIVTLGIAQAPEGRELFSNTTVRENLLAGQYTRKDRVEMKVDWDRVLEWFPILGDRMHQLAGTLSGGEQQMLAVSRAFLCHPELLVLDEPSLGLSPLLVRNIFQTITRMNRETGLTILLAEQNVGMALSIAHWGYVLERGRVAVNGDGALLLGDATVRHSYLGGA